MIVEFEGRQHEFPDGTSDEDIAAALGGGVGYGEPKKPFLEKLGNFARNVYNNPPPTIAGIAKTIKEAPAAAQELTWGADPAAAESAAGTMLGAAALGSPVTPAVRAGEAPAFVANAFKSKPTGIAPKAEPIPERPAPLVRPSSVDLGKEAGSNYKRAFEAIEGVDATAMRDTYGAALTKIEEDFHPTEAPKTFAVLRNALEKYTERDPDPLAAMTGAKPAARAAATGKDIEATQKLLRVIKPSAEHPSDNAAAKQARALIDEALATIPDEFVKGDAEAFRSGIAAGRGNTAAKYRMRAVEAAEERGNLNAATASSGGNVENTGRQSFKSLVRPPVSGAQTPAQKIGFNAEEQAMLRSVADPGLLRDAIRGAGKLAPTDPWRILGNAEAARWSGGMSLPFSAAAYVAKKVGDKQMRQDMQRALNLVAARSPLYRQRYNEWAAKQAAYLSKLQAAEGIRGGVLGAIPRPPYGAARGILPQYISPQELR